MKSLLALVLLGAVLSAGSAAARPQPVFGAQHSLALAPGNGTETSSNWAGYAVTHRKPFASVTGRWMQPAAICNGLD
ncbi:MAG: hypothetical protein ACTHNB_09665, partial [Gaiellaceae bacterium]